MLCCVLVGCGSRQNSGFEAAIINDSTTVALELGEPNRLSCYVEDSLTGEWPLRYPVYQYQYGDVDGDGSTDVAVGVYKRTRYDSVKRNRLFLYQIRNNAIIPLWLGTSVGHPIVDFRVYEDTTGQHLVRIVGKEQTDKYLVADFEWYGFGLSLKQYVKRDLSIELAKEILYNHN